MLATQRGQEQNLAQPMVTEIMAYEREELVPISTNILQWWNVTKVRFPRLARMARDYLSIQASSVASESLFSLAGNMVTDKRNLLTDEMIEAVMCLKSWKKNEE
ncbi:hypothetical protein P9112_003007 [Eukaryota sp. TZLM1-RC]